MPSVLHLSLNAGSNTNISLPINIVADNNLILDKTTCNYSPTNSDCAITVKGNAKGSYSITPVIGADFVGKFVAESVAVNVLESASISFAESTVYLKTQDSTSEVLTLNGAASFANPITVNLKSSDTYLNITPSSCTLGVAQPTCNINMQSRDADSASHTVTAISEDTALESATLQVYVGGCGKVTTTEQALTCAWNSFKTKESNIEITSQEVYNTNLDRATKSFSIPWDYIGLVYYGQYVLDTLYPDLVDFTNAVKSKDFNKMTQSQAKYRQDLATGFTNPQTSGAAYNSVWVATTALNEVFNYKSQMDEAKAYATLQYYSYLATVVPSTAYNFISTDGMNYFGQAVNTMNLNQCQVYVTNFQNQISNFASTNVEMNLFLNELDPNSLLRWMVYFTSPKHDNAFSDGLDAMYGYLEGKTIINNQVTSIDICNYDLFKQELAKKSPNIYAVNFNKLVNSISSKFGKDPQSVYWLLVAEVSYLIEQQMQQTTTSMQLNATFQ